MRFDNGNIRRKDRTLNEMRCIELLETAEYGILSLHDETHGVYGIPINYVWDNQSALYYHCAPEGKKIRIIEQDHHASFCIVGESNVISDKFTTEYESVILSGSIYQVVSDEEKIRALTLLLDKYCPEDKEQGLVYAQKSFSRTNILRLDIEVFSGKAKKINLR